MDVNDYVRGLKLDELDPFAEAELSYRSYGTHQAVVDYGAILAFDADVTPDERQDVLESVQLAQRAASGRFDRFTDLKRWYEHFNEVLAGVGWVLGDAATVWQEQKAGELKLDREALEVLSAIASGGALQILTKAFAALQGANTGNAALSLFESKAVSREMTNFQAGAVSRRNGDLTMAVGAYRFSSRDGRWRTIFFEKGDRDAAFWSSAQTMRLNLPYYAQAREAVTRTLGNPADFVAAIGPLA